MTLRTRRHLAKLCISLLTALLLVSYNYYQQRHPASPVLTQAGYYHVSQFVDGDTIIVDMGGTQETLRFIGVDTPETHDPRKPVECFGQAAANFTKDLIGTNPVRLQADPLNTNRDRYHRLLRYIYLPDGRLVNAEIIKQGYGFAYVGFPFQKLDEFRADEKQAREQNLGLWGDCPTTKSPYGGYTSVIP